MTTPTTAASAGEHIEGDVGDVLAEGRAEGLVFYLPDRQLPRPLYVKVDKALQALGGKWDRSARGHVFLRYPGTLVTRYLETGEVPDLAEPPPQNPDGFYSTPVRIAEVLLGGRPLPMIPDTATRILEPSAGTGALAGAVVRHCEERGIAATVECCEISPARRAVLESRYKVVGGDFLTYTEGGYDAIVMNPPFALPTDRLAYVTHIEHAWTLLAPGGVLLAIAPQGLIFRRDRKVMSLRGLFISFGAWRHCDSYAFATTGTDVNTVFAGVTRPAA